MSRCVTRGSNSPKSTIRVLPTMVLGPRKRVGSHPFSAGLWGSRDSYWLHCVTQWWSCWENVVHSLVSFLSFERTCIRLLYEKKNLGFFCVLTRRHLGRWRELIEAYKSLKPLQIQAKYFACTESHKGNPGLWVSPQLPPSCSSPNVSYVFYFALCESGSNYLLLATETFFFHSTLSSEVRTSFSDKRFQPLPSLYLLCAHTQEHKVLLYYCCSQDQQVAELKADVHTSQEHNFRCLLIFAGIIFSITASLIFFVTIMATNTMMERFSLGKKKKSLKF